MHDHRRCNVPVENAPAITAVHALGQRFDGDGPAFRARLGGSSRVDFDQFSTSFRSFVPQHRDECAPRGIVNGLRKHTASEARDIQFLNCNAAETVDDLAALLVQEVAATVRNISLMSGYGGLAFATYLGPTFTTGQSTLQAPEFLRRVVSEVRPVDRLAITECDERREAEIKPDSVWAGPLNLRDFDVEDDVPLACVAAENAGLGLRRHVTVPADLDLARDADESDLPALSDGHAVADAEVGRVISVASPKPRETRCGATLYATEKCLISPIQLAYNVLLCCGRPAPLMGKVAPYLRKSHDLLVDIDRDAVPVGVDPMFKGGVIEFAEIAKHLIERRCLRAGWLNSVSVIEDHGSLAVQAADKFSNYVSNCASMILGMSHNDFVLSLWEAYIDCSLRCWHTIVSKASCITRQLLTKEGGAHNVETLRT